MSGNPLDRIPAFDRVSIRAVLVRDGEDPIPALAAAGIIDPIAIPVVMGDELNLSGGILGDGITPNLIAVLETEQTKSFETSSYNSPHQAASRQDTARAARRGTTTLPEAFGQRSFAPIGGLDIPGLNPRSGRFGDRPAVRPPSPGQSLHLCRVLATGWRNRYTVAGNGPDNEISNQARSAQFGEGSGFADKRNGEIEGGTIGPLDPSNQKPTAMIDHKGQGSIPGTQFAGPGAPQTIGANAYVPAPGDANLLARMMFTEAAGATPAYPGIGWAAVNRVNSMSMVRPVVWPM